MNALVERPVESSSLRALCWRAVVVLGLIPWRLVAAEPRRTG